MGKRFTDTEKWRDTWFRALTPIFKHAWNYLCDNCDIAGVIDLDRGLANFQIGDTLDWDAFIEAAGQRVAKLACGKLWLPGFISFQYGVLSAECRPHQSVLVILRKYAPSERVIEEYLKSCQRLKDKDKDKDQDQDRKGERGKPRRQISAESVPVPEGFDTGEVRTAIRDWLTYKSTKGQPYKDPSYLGRKVAEFAQAGPAAFVAAVNSSIGSNYDGLFPAKDFNGRNNRASSGRPNPSGAGSLKTY